MAYCKINYMINDSQKCLIKTHNNEIFHKTEKLIKKSLKNLVIKRILIILFTLYIKIQLSECDNPIITLIMKNKGNISIINEAFKSYLLEVYIDDINMTNIETFYNFNKKNTAVKIKLNSQINNFSKMFINCNNISEINFINFDLSNIIGFSEVFKNCNNLKSINLSDWDISGVTNINSLFQDCKSLTSIGLPNLKRSNITTMKYVFSNCQKLTSIDLSRIDTSQVTNMESMFYNCKILTSLDLSNFITHKLTNVLGMFSGYQKIISLDLFNFDTSQITNMKDFFKNCHSLISLNISNFNTSSVKNMDRTFCHCSSLTSLDLTHFDTSKVTDMYKMFSECFILVDLNISNFNTSSVKNMSHMFSNGFKLQSLDLSGFTMEEAINITYMFNNTPNLEYINLKNSNPRGNIIITNLFIGTSKNLVICTESDIIIQQKNISNCSVISCSDNWRNEQKKIYLNQCYDNCNNTENKYDYLSQCVDTCPNSTYIYEYLSKCVDICPDSTYIVDNKCEKCHSDCKTCAGPYNDTNSNCDTCLSPYKHLEDGHCLLKNYINITYLLNTTNNTLIYNIIKENLIPSFDPEKEFEILSEAFDDVVFQITTSKNQLKALTNNSLNYNNLSILDISNCETILKDKYNLNENDSLIILKKEKKSNKASEKEVQLEIYEPYNKTKLNLSFCKDTNINIYVKAELSNEIKYSYEKLKSLGYNMFNSNDPFYQDVCTSYTSYGSTDIILSDRINYIYNNDDTKCQPNCKLSKYSEESEYLNCSCNINEEVNNMEQKFSSKKIYNSFLNVLKYSNYKVLKCYNLIFTKYLITNNIGSIIIIIFIVIYLVCFIIFIIKRINPLKVKLKLMVENKFKSNVLNNNEIIFLRKFFCDNNNKNNDEESRFEITKKKNVKKRKKRKIKKNKKIKQVETNAIEKNKNGFEIKEILDDFELNELDFYEAIKLDKRTFIQMYINILKREHPILFTFCNFNDYNLIYIKLVRFIFLISTDMAMNVFFFSDESMHKLYIDYGKYDFIQQIPQILYSTIVSKLFEIILCYLSLTDKPIHQIKNKILKNSSIEMRIIYKCINIKLIIFFIFTFIFLIFYWYTISAFCSVYKNTQIAFIKDCIFSFLLGILIPFPIYLIPSALRICAIKNRNCKCSIFIYKLSDIIPIF